MQALQKQILDLYPQTLLEWEGARDDRARMVRPAPKGFAPTAPGRHLNLTLELARPKIKPGGAIWYRLEMQNIGSEAIDITDPIFKHPSLLMSRVKFFADGPGLKNAPLLQATLLGGHDPETLFERELKTPVEIAAVFREQRESFKSGPVRVTLFPGETVFTAPLKPLKEAPPALSGGYHRFELREYIGANFNTPGKYLLHCVYAENKPSPPSEEFIRKMESRGSTRAEELASHQRRLQKWIPPIKSNTVTIEVLR